jgi:hypothetical protein
MLRCALGEDVVHSGERGSETFGALLRFYREHAGLTLEALGSHVQYSKSQVAMVERGGSGPRRGNWSRSPIRY